MSEEQESNYKPLEPGQLKLSTAEQSKPELPNGVMFEVHVDELGTDNFGEGDRLSVKFVIDSGEYKGQSFKKWFTPLATPNAGFTKLVNAVLGALPSDNLDPTVIVGKPLQVIFGQGQFNGKAVQTATYLPPAKGQQVPAKDVVLTDLSDATDLEEEFKKALGA